MVRAKAVQDVGMSNLSSQPWWMVPDNFNAPMELYIEEEQEEQIFGRGDMYLRSIEVHSQSLIQVESWFTAQGQTRVSIVGPRHARQWLMDMFWSLRHIDSSQQAQGLQMLQRVRNKPLTKNDFRTSVRMQPNTGDFSLASRLSGTVSLDVPPASSFPWSCCF
ncbi:KH homology domain-containing protein 1-like [Ochotona princeps]|uniref:KH homology domain-containing protein 1-like n=1 Tax=Ochotona princeps TaxID=9978 RepID=UPI00271484F1|nr:KH homology domain-containing protein 1-like [Ochotona princeps]